tara:strand:+ start:805 stop:1554 length:750 start_codon:yes stop_codon:yes gene_type:complete
MTFWRVQSKARSTKVALEGLYQGASGYLVGGSPQLLDLDLRLLRMPGCWSMAINNAAVVFEPNAFIALDVAGCFNSNIFSNTRIIKLLNYARHNETIGEKRVCEFPNTLFFDMEDEIETLMSEFCSMNGPLPYWRNTFFTALACMYQLGFRNVYLLGCTFDTKKGAYAHGEGIRESDKAANQAVYDDSVEKMSRLVPMLDDEGMKVMTCHEGTALEGIVPYVSFEESISRVTTESSSIEFNFYKHVNES